MKKTLALLLAVLLVVGAAAGALGDEKQEADFHGFDDIENWKLYTVDSLQDGCYPVYKHEIWLNPFGVGLTSPEEANSSQLEYLSGDAGEAEQYLQPSPYTQNIIEMFPLKMTQPGTSEWRIRGESKHLKFDKTFTLNVMDQQDDPEWVMPKSSIVYYAEPEKNIYAGTVASMVTDLRPASFSFYPVDAQPDSGGSSSSDITYNTPGTYKVNLRLGWGSFFTITAVTLFVCPKETENGADGTVVVKNYEELVNAVNSTLANHILISPEFKYGKTDFNYLHVYGERKVTISPEAGERAVIDGTLYISGDGSVVLDKVDIESKTIGLFLEDGINVTACSVRGGDAPDSGFPAVVVSDSKLTVEEAVGGNGKTGIGGDGIYCMGDAVVEAGITRGGNAATGVGGGGIVAMGGAKATVTGDATGGDGQIACGKGILTGINSEINVQGRIADGTLLESKKPVNPDEIVSFALLQNALRNGKTEIQLSPKFRIIEKNWEQGYGLLPLFTSGDQLITIFGPSEKKSMKVNGNISMYFGNWKCNGIDLNNTQSTATLTVAGNAHVEWNGNLTASGKATNALYAVGNACVAVNGDIVSSVNNNYPAAAFNGSPSVTINGNITSGTISAAILRGGKIRIVGNVKVQGNSQSSAITIVYGQLDLTGNITCDKETACAQIIQEGILRIRGNVKTKSQKWYALYTSLRGMISIEGTLEAPHPGRSTNTLGGIFVNGKQINE